MSAFVANDKWAALSARFAALGVNEADIAESFTRSGGHGGQNVNKVSTCVILVHALSGLTVRCQEERTQGMNRYRARVRLLEKLEEKIKGAQSAKQQAIEKIRRQKRKRSKRAKEKLLADKHHRSSVKSGRGRVGSDE